MAFGANRRVFLDDILGSPLKYIAPVLSGAVFILAVINIVKTISDALAK